MPKKIYIRTFGCQMNERDSESISAALLSDGYEMVSSEDQAEVILFNTCSVRELAERKVIGKISLLKKMKKEKPDLIIGVIGCMAQRLGAELIEKLPHIDFVVGTSNLHDVAELINCEIRKREKIVKTDGARSDKIFTSLMNKHISAENKISAFISIMRGCDRFCSYCIVPYVRGREKSRSVEDIVGEATELAKNGIKEIMLLGQNVAGFGMKGVAQATSESKLGELLTELNRIEGILRIRFTSPHPLYFNDGLINAVAELPKVCKNIHLPLQSGSDIILEKMNRNYSSAYYLEIVKKLKKLVPDITFSTDIIVGFPGETESDFEETRKIVEEVGFDNAFIFKYSTREGTKSAKFADNVPYEVKEERNHILLDDLARIALKRNKRLLGMAFEVLVEGPSKRNPSRYCGRTDTNKVVVFEPIEGIKPGNIALIEIKNVTATTLYGEIRRAAV